MGARAREIVIMTSWQPPIPSAHEAKGTYRRADYDWMFGVSCSASQETH